MINSIWIIIKLLVWKLLNDLFVDTIRWPEGLTMLMFYKASDTALLSACRLLLTLSRNKVVKRIAKFLFLLHLFNWFVTTVRSLVISGGLENISWCLIVCFRIYLHVLLVPGSLILHSGVNCDRGTRVTLWMWLACEIVNSVRWFFWFFINLILSPMLRYKLWISCLLQIRSGEFRCMYSSQSLETSLFPPPSQEAVEFVNIIKKHRSSANETRWEDEEDATRWILTLHRNVFPLLNLYFF